MICNIHSHKLKRGTLSGNKSFGGFFPKGKEKNVLFMIKKCANIMHLKSLTPPDSSKFVFNFNHQTRVIS